MPPGLSTVINDLFVAWTIHRLTTPNHQILRCDGNAAGDFPQADFQASPKGRYSEPVHCRYPRTECAGHRVTSHGFPPIYVGEGISWIAQSAFYTSFYESN